MNLLVGFELLFYISHKKWQSTRVFFIADFNSSVPNGERERERGERLRLRERQTDRRDRAYKKVIRPLGEISDLHTKICKLATAYLASYRSCKTVPT